MECVIYDDGYNDANNEPSNNNVGPANWYVYEALNSQADNRLNSTQIGRAGLSGSQTERTGRKTRAYSHCDDNRRYSSQVSRWMMQVTSGCSQEAVIRIV